MRMPSSTARASLELQIEKYQQQAGPAESYLASRGISSAAMTRFRLGYTGDDDNFIIRHRLAIPYLTPVGAWLIKYRCIADHNCGENGHGKYIYEPGSTMHLFNAAVLNTADTVVVTEGELDAIAVETQCGISAVAYPGAEMWAKNQAWRWCFDSVSEVIVVADGDEPGQKAASVVTNSIRSAIQGEVRTVHLPVGQDSNSFIAEHGDMEFLETIGIL